MKDLMLNWKRRLLAWFGLHAIQELIGNVVQFGICGSLGGLVFGCLRAQGSGNFLFTVLTATVGGIAGFITGAMAGALREIWGMWNRFGKSLEITIGEVSQYPKKLRVPARHRQNRSWEYSVKCRSRSNLNR